MFFKRKNVNPEFEKRVEQISHDSEDTNPVERLSSVDTSSQSRSSEANVEKEKAIDEARKVLEQELSIKHFFHKQLLETLDLGLLSSLEKERAKVDLHEAILQLMADDGSHALSAEGRKRVIKQIERVIELFFLD